MAIKPAEAAKAVFDYLSDISNAGGVKCFPDYTVEEICTDDNQDYLITLSRVAVNENMYDSSLPCYLSTAEFRFFKVNKESAAVEWMKKSQD